MRLIVGLLMLTLLGCRWPGDRNPSVGQVDDASLAQARRMDAIEQLIEQERYPAAARALDEALAEGLEHPRAFLLMGRLLVREATPAQLEAALVWFDRAIAASPAWWEPRLDLARAYFTLGRLDAAEAVFYELDRLFPEHPAGPYGMGLVASQRHQLSLAEEHFTEALKRDPDHLGTLQACARLARQRGDEGAQRQYLERLLSRLPQQADLRIELAGLEEKAGRLASARRLWEEAYRQRADPATARRLSSIARQLGDTAAAERWWRLAGGSGSQDIDSPLDAP